MEDSDNIRKNLSRLNSVLDSAQLGIWDWYPQTNQVIFNKQWKKMVGYNDNDLPNNLSAWDRLIHPDDKEETYKILNEHLEDRTDYYISEHRLKHKKGHYIWILDTGKVVERNEEGKPLRATGIHQDITHRKELEEKLRREKISADQASKAKSMFLANMSHEIRTPMNGVLGSAQMLEESNLDDFQRELIGIISQSTEYLLSIINDILDFSKIEANSLILRPERFNLQQLIKKTKNIFTTATKGKDIDFIVNGPKDSINVIGDQPRILQIIINLVSNAIKFTDNGYVLLDIKDQPNGIKIIVKDTGMGMTKKFIDEIFTPFLQADSTKTKAIKGTGLGTTITKNLVDLMKGEINIESCIGEGTTICVTLPLKIDKSNKETNINTSKFNRNYQKATVILAEDNNINAKVATMILNKIGLDVLLANNGLEVLNIINTGKQHELILMDCQMPMMDGETVTKKLRQDGYKKPIIAMTGNVYMDDQKRYLKIGMNDVIPKPFKIEKLTNILDKYLMKR